MLYIDNTKRKFYIYYISNIKEREVSLSIKSIKII
jgi:hypothetical protein